MRLTSSVNEEEDGSKKLHAVVFDVNGETIIFGNIGKSDVGSRLTE